jgi:hypothetical protein
MPLVGLVTASMVTLVGAFAPAAHATGTLGVKVWEAGTCATEKPMCTYASVQAKHSDAYTRAAGHPPWGITTFELNSTENLITKQLEPKGAPLKRVRVDVPPGLASNPQAPLNPGTHQKCSIAQFEASACPEGSEVGTDEAKVFVGGADVEAKGKVYNLEPQPGEPFPTLKFEPIPLLFGIAITFKTPLNEIVLERSFLEGHVAWFGDYHEYFEINNLSEKTPILKSQLNFNGHAGGNFITLPSECSPTQISYLEVESWTGEGKGVRTPTQPPLGVEACDKVPFEPTTEVKPETSQSDAPDGATTEVKVPQYAGEEEINSADVKDAHVTLPEGLTLNSAAARGLTACTAAQIRIGSQEPVICPAASKVGEVTIETDLPAKSLTGNVYLGAPSGEPITGPPYTIYVDAESARYGVSVRLEGQVNPNPVTGRLETTFLKNPQLPFSDFILKLNGGPQAPLANPLACGAAATEWTFTPFTGLSAFSSSSPFAITGCPSPLPFVWGQSTGDQPSSAGAFGNTSYTFNLARTDGQQYLSQVKTVLPAGLVGAIPSVTLCGEPQARSGECPASSRIGTATVGVGAGSEPYPLSAPVFMTGPYGGAPFGLSIPVAAVAGPFNLGTVMTRVAIGVDPHTSRVIATTSPLTTIVKGVPVRLKSVSVTVNRPNFLYNPTNCGPLATDSVLTSTALATQSLSSPFAVSGCGALAFTPSFKASTSAHPSRANGESLQVNVTQPAHQANIRSVVTQLPVQLPSRLTTLQQACPEATYASNPFSCPAGSNVGSATATTPVLPGTLSGPAYLVSHGGAAFPDLDLLLEGSGVRVILVGNTDIKRGITISSFATLPDVPVSSFSLNLPMGPHSALAAYGNLCAPLVMPTTITAQSGAQIKQNTRITVAGCAGSAGAGCIKVLRRKVASHTLKLTLRVCAAGRVKASGKYLKGATRKLRKASTTTLKLPLRSGGVRALHRHRPLKIRVRITFVPTRRGERRASATTAVTFKR